MAVSTIAGFAKHMANLDICMMSTQSPRGTINSRPMSNNGDVKYKGQSYFFTYEKSQKIKDITANKQVALNFEGENEMYITVEGKAKLLRRRSDMEDHWQDSLSQWFEDGLDTPGIVLIEVQATRIKYWQKNKEGEIRVKKG